MSRKAKLILALTGMVVVLICEVVAILKPTLATRPVFVMGFAAIAAGGFWAMSFHRPGR
jgi:hypothetical protein